MDKFKVGDRIYIKSKYSMVIAEITSIGEISYKYKFLEHGIGILMGGECTFPKKDLENESVLFNSKLSKLLYERKRI